jgi:hypothetical protein
MRPENMLQQRGQRHEQAEEEDDRKQVSHSFSPYLSTAKVPKGRSGSLGQRHCSCFVLMSSDEM